MTTKPPGSTAGPNWQFTEVPIGGVDLHTDPLAVQAPKVLVAENTALDMPGRARKRDGMRRRAGPAVKVRVPGSYPLRTFEVRDPRWIAVEQSGRILGHADNLLLSETGGEWFVRGFVDQMRITAGRPFFDPTQYLTAATPTSVDVGAAGDVLVLVLPAYGNAAFRLAFLDAVTGALIHPVIDYISTIHVRPCLVSLPNGCCILFVATTTGLLQALSMAGDQIRNTSATALLATMAQVVNDVKVPGPLYDVTAVGQRVALTYVNSTGDVARCWVGANGRREGNVQYDETNANTIAALAIHYGASAGQFLIAWANDTVPFLKARDFQIDEAMTGGADARTLDDEEYGYKQIAITVRNTTWMVLYCTGDAVLQQHAIRIARWRTAETVDPISTIDPPLRHASLVSKTWTDATTGRIYCLVAYESQAQPSVQVTYFVYAVRGVDDGTYCERDADDRSWTLVGILWPGVAGGVLRTPGLPTPVVQGRKVFLALTVRGEQTEAARSMGTRVVTIEHAPGDGQPAVQGLDGASYIPAGLLWRIDEALNGLSRWSATESGFALSPDNCTASSSTGGDLTPNASYGYRYFYRDAATGERSSTFAFTFSTAAGQGTLIHQIPRLSHTNRWYVTIEVFRTTANPVPGAPYYYVGEVVTSIDYNVNAVNYTDTLSDAVLITRRRDYISLGQVDEDVPPACGVIAMGQGWAALAGVDDDGTVWLTKHRAPGEPLRWSSLLLAIADAPVPGRIKAMAWNGPALIIWRGHSISVLVGEPPDDAGFGGTLQPQLVVSESVGCLTPRSLVRVPSGWLFQATEGGYWHLSTEYALTNAGADVEPLGEPCLGAFVLHQRKQAVFVNASRTLIYHYETGAWTVDRRGGISAAGVPNGPGLYLPDPTGLRLLEDDPTTCLDDGIEYTQRIRLAWFRPAGVEGEIMIRRILFSGGYQGKHRPRVHLYYDYEPGFNETVEWRADEVVGVVTEGDGVKVFGGPARLGATQVYQFSVPVARERCMAIGVEILDGRVIGEPLDGSFWLTAVGYEWAPVGPAGSAAYRMELRRMAEVED